MRSNRLKQDVKITVSTRRGRSGNGGELEATLA